MEAVATRDLALALLQSLTREDLEDPEKGLPKVLPILEKVEKGVRHQYARNDLIRSFHRDNGLSLADAIRLVDGIEENPLCHEIGPCRSCEGFGHISEPACLGVKMKPCAKCHGRNPKHQLRVRLPWDPHGDPITWEEYMKRGTFQ